MKQLILFTLILSLVSSYNANPSFTISARDEQTGDCLRKGNCKD